MFGRIFDFLAGTHSNEAMYRWCQIEFKKDADFAYHLMKEGRDPWKYIRRTQK
jgi:hypothetical protein